MLYMGTFKLGGHVVKGLDQIKRDCTHKIPSETASNSIIAYIYKQCHYNVMFTLYDKAHLDMFPYSGPRISVLIPLPALTSSNAFSASSNLTLPVIRSLTFTRPLSSSCTASL